MSPGTRVIRKCGREIVNDILLKSELQHKSPGSVFVWTEHRFYKVSRKIYTGIVETHCVGMMQI